MSSFLSSTRTTIASRLAFRPSSYTALSAFHTSPASRALKESDQNRDDLGNIYEAEKEQQLKENKEGKGRWKQELASNSEASVKADREGLEDTKSMQDRTKDLPNKEKPPHT